jgi:hypothetical protein
MTMMQHNTDYVLFYGESRNNMIRSKKKDDDDDSIMLVLVLLNYHLPRFTPILWDQASLHVCADGGANRLYDELPLWFPDDDPADVRQRHKPDVIKGDLDSIRPEVKEYYSQMVCFQFPSNISLLEVMYQDVPPKSYQAYVFSPRFASHLLCVDQYF